MFLLFFLCITMYVYTHSYDYTCICANSPLECPSYTSHGFCKYALLHIIILLLAPTLFTRVSLESSFKGALLYAMGGALEIIYLAKLLRRCPIIYKQAPLKMRYCIYIYIHRFPVCMGQQKRGETSYFIIWAPGPRARGLGPRSGARGPGLRPGARGPGAGGLGPEPRSPGPRARDPGPEAQGPGLGPGGCGPGPRAWGLGPWAQGWGLGPGAWGPEPGALG